MGIYKYVFINTLKTDTNTNMLKDRLSSYNVNLRNSQPTRISTNKQLALIICSLLYQKQFKIQLRQPNLDHLADILIFEAKNNVDQRVTPQETSNIRQLSPANIIEFR